jgi:hypothetical protein
MEPVKKGTRQKSTNATASPAATTSSKSAKLSIAAAEDASITSTAAQGKTSRTKLPTVAADTSPSHPITPPDAASESFPVTTQSSIKSSPPKVTPTNSKILNQVRALSSKTPSAAKSYSATSKHSNPTSPTSTTSSTVLSKSTKSLTQTNETKSSAPAPSSTTSPPKAQQESPLSSRAGIPKTPSSQPSSSPSSSQPQTQTPQKSIPIAALNSTIVSQISSRAGARPGRPPADLLVNYKPVARRVTLAIVALPIAIVTSWILYQRRKFSIYLQCDENGTGLETLRKWLMSYSCLR